MTNFQQLCVNKIRWSTNFQQLYGDLMSEPFEDLPKRYAALESESTERYNLIIDIATLAFAQADLHDPDMPYYFLPAFVGAPFEDAFDGFCGSAFRDSFSDLLEYDSISAA